jgi:hypothetical protein
MGLELGLPHVPYPPATIRDHEIIVRGLQTVDCFPSVNDVGRAVESIHKSSDSSSSIFKTSDIDPSIFKTPTPS